MKKLPNLIYLGVLLLLVLVFQYNKPQSNHRILEANLAAALSLESKYIATCGNPKFDLGESMGKAPLLEGLGSHTFPISVDNEMAQRYFDQGLNLAYAFNHTESHRSFKEASNLAKGSPMPYWGQAYAIGPNINDPFIDEQRKLTAVESLKKADSLLTNANDLEKALIKALTARYVTNSDSVIVDNVAYMQEMKMVAESFPKHADVQTLYAAAIMNTMPWNYWELDKKPKENTLAAKEALSKAVAINKKHAGAYHYHIHLTELPFPDEAAKSGDALKNLMPGAGHIVHMPSHAYIRVGRYKDAAEANLNAILADEAYISQCYSQGIYPLGYYPHNIHFLWAAATQMGDSQTALAAARKTSEKASMELLEVFPVLQEFKAVPIQAYVRFGKWNELLTIPHPGEKFKHLKVFWNYGRGLAFIKKGNIEKAKETVSLLKAMSTDSTLSNIVLYSNNNTGQIAKIAHDVVAAELAASLGNNEQAKAFFKSAIKAEDALNYTEPPAWPQSSRLHYGDFLVKTGAFVDAVKVYQEDLEVWRNNGWALRGLYNAYMGDGQKEKAESTMKQFKASWQYSDIEIKSAVL